MLPAGHRDKWHSTNPIERLNGEIKRRTEVVGIFPARTLSLLRFQRMLLSRKIVAAILVLISSSLSAGELHVNGFPADANFFPIGVWMQSPIRAARYKAIGINTFVGLWEGPTEQQLAALARQDMYVVAEQNDVGLKSVNGHVIKAWMQQDEPDNAQPIGLGLYGTCIAATEVTGPACLNTISASISGASAEFRPPSGVAAG